MHIEGVTADGQIGLPAGQPIPPVLGSEAVVATWGTFDGALHPGHLYLLKRCKEFGALTVFLLNNDRIVLQKRRQPILDQVDRADNLMRTGLVDRIIIGSSDANENLRMTVELQPDVYCFGKGQSGQWNEELEVQLRRIGSRIVRVSAYKPDVYSTTFIYFGGQS